MLRLGLRKEHIVLPIPETGDRDAAPLSKALTICGRSHSAKYRLPVNSRMRTKMKVALGSPSIAAGARCG